MKRRTVVRMGFLWAAGLAAARTARGLPAGEVWIVDDDGGASVDFVDLPPAVAAAAAGDVILVRPGAYSAFDLAVGVRIVGTQGVSVASGSVVHELDPAENAVIAGLALADLDVQQCAGTVLVDSVVFGPTAFPSLLRADTCDDVRLHACTMIAGLQQVAAACTNARVEIVASVLVGGDGPTSQCGFLDVALGRDGAHGIAADQSRVHVAHSSVRGGAGGDSEESCINEICWNDYPGNGGDAIDITGSHAIVSGEASDELRAGRLGYGGIPECDGFNGSPLYGIVHQNSTARLSGVTLLDG